MLYFYSIENARVRARWNPIKDYLLMLTRGLGFKEVLKGRFVKITQHPKRESQKILFIWHKDYIWLVPHVRQGDDMFLKTLYPSRKYTKLYKTRKFP